MEILISEIRRISRTKELEYVSIHRDEMFIKQLDINCYENDTKYYVDAIIEQNQHSNIIKIVVSEAYQIVEYNCSCPYCNNFWACAHVVFVCEKINEIKPRIFPYSYAKEVNKVNQDKVNNRKYLDSLSPYQKFIRDRKLELGKSYMQEHEEFMKNMFAPKIKKDMKIKILFDTTLFYSHNDALYGYFIRFKIGNDKMYYIKHLPNFADAVKKQQYYKYGKELNFMHSRDCFDEPSKLIVDYILEYVSKDVYFDKKGLVVNEDNVDSFDSLLQQLPDDYYDFMIEDSNVKINIDVEKDYDYKFSLSDIYTDLIAGKQGFYWFNRGNFNRCITNEIKGLALLYRKMKREDILISEEDIEQFVAMFIKPNESSIVLTNQEVLPLTLKVDYIQLYADIDEEGMIDVSMIAYLEDGSNVHAFSEQYDHYLPQFRIIEDYISEYSSFVDYDVKKAYIDFNQNLGKKFVLEGLVYLHNYCEVYVSDALKRISQKTKISMKVGVSIKNDLLQIDVSSLELDQSDIYEVLKAYKRKKKFHRLKDGRLIDLQDEGIEEASQMLDDLNINVKDIEKGKAKVAIYRSFHLQDMDEESKYLEFDFRDDYKAYLARYDKQKKQPIEIPANYVNVLRDYQKEGYRWLKLMNQYHFHGILADEMGLGKTLQVICLLESEKENDKTSLVITPSSLLYNWDQEIKKFSNNLSVACISGNQETRKFLIDTYQNYDIVITTYDYLKRDIDLYEDKTFKYVVIDEAQYIKNPKTKNAQCVKRLQGEYRLALTGTPIENSLAELWSIFDFLMPGYLFNYHYFNQTYEKPIVAFQDEKQSQKLKRLVEPFILRRLKQDVLNELPDKTELVYPISFNDEEERLYIANLAKVNADLALSLQMDKPNKMVILSMLTKLRQICCEPRVLFDNITTPSSKLKSCMELIMSMKQANQKALLFSSFTSVLDLITLELDKNHISYAVLTGATSKEKRKDLVDKFQNGLYDVFLISLKAGGTGLNLTAASNVIHYDPWWNVSAQNQATDRAHRIGQNNKVTVYKLIMKNSIEEKIQILQAKKKQLSDTFVEGNEGSINDMSFDDIVSLFEM